jgi:hypothetical protein
MSVVSFDGLRAKKHIKEYMDVCCAFLQQRAEGAEQEQGKPLAITSALLSLNMSAMILTDLMNEKQGNKQEAEELLSMYLTSNLELASLLADELGIELNQVLQKAIACRKGV